MALIPFHNLQECNLKNVKTVFGDLVCFVFTWTVLVTFFVL